MLVTGAASGLGRAFAEACAREGARLVLMDRDEAKLAEAAGPLAEIAPDVSAYIMDVSLPSSVAEAFGRVDELHEVDAAFLNAGINGGLGMRLPDGHIDALPHDTWRKVMGVNLDGTFYTLQRISAHMKRRKTGSIIVTGSTAGVRPEPFVSYAYVTSKAAVHALATQAALELVKYGIRVNVIAPGPVRTNIAGGPLPAEKTAMWEKTIPMGRFADPSEFAGLAVLLASEESSFMTGATFRVDGGASILTQLRADEF